MSSRSIPPPSGGPWGSLHAQAPPVPDPPHTATAELIPPTRGVTPVHTPGQRLRVGAAVAVVLAGAGAAVDLATGIGLRRVFDACLIGGCVLAALVVRRDRLRAVLFLPPLVYAVMALASTVSEGVDTGQPLRALMVDQGIALFSALVLNAPALLAATLLTALIVLVRTRRAR